MNAGTRRNHGAPSWQQDVQDKAINVKSTAQMVDLWPIAAHNFFIFHRRVIVIVWGWRVSPKIKSKSFKHAVKSEKRNVKERRENRNEKWRDTQRTVVEKSLTKRESKEREKGKMKIVINPSHIMLTTLNILGARLLLACSHSLASLQCVSSDLRLTCCSILSLIMLLFLSLPRSFKPRANKMLMKLADWVASNLFCRSLFLSIASSHSLCFYITWFSAARWLAHSSEEDDSYHISLYSSIASSSG